jgi:hypothetical protein
MAQFMRLYFGVGLVTFVISLVSSLAKKEIPMNKKLKNHKPRATSHTSHEPRELRALLKTSDFGAYSGLGGLAKPNQIELFLAACRLEM